MTGLGIIDTDLCLWANSATPAMVEDAWLVPGHPVVKAKPGPIAGLFPPPGAGGWLCSFNRWVADHPILAAATLAGGYVLLGRTK